MHNSNLWLLQYDERLPEAQYRDLVVPQAA
jgi:hypothetical protein